MTQEILALAVILIAAEAGGLAAAALRLPRVTGQIAAGVLVGPSVLGLVGEGPTVRLLAELGALCILALAGLETDIGTLVSVRRPAILAASGGVVLPFAAGVVVTLALGHPLGTALFVGAVLTATSVGITAATLRDLGTLGSRAGATIMGAAVADDVLGLVVLALVVASVTGTASPLASFGAMLAVAGGTAVVAVAGRRWLPAALRVLESFGGGLPALLGLVLAAAWAYEALGGLAGITGAYFAGLLLAGSDVGERLRERLAHVGDAIGAPVFFVAIGLSADMRSIGPAVVLGVVLLVVAIVGKLVGSGLGARIGGLPGQDSLTVGIGMIARGEVALVAASTGLAAGAIGGPVYAALILVALATTIVTPVLLAGAERWPLETWRIPRLAIRRPAITRLAIRPAARAAGPAPRLAAPRPRLARVAVRRTGPTVQARPFSGPWSPIASTELPEADRWER
jgi:Kef-type K+ transport system membrane component KefB